MPSVYIDTMHTRQPRIYATIRFFIFGDEYIAESNTAPTIKPRR